MLRVINFNINNKPMVTGLIIYFPSIYTLTVTQTQRTEQNDWTKEPEQQDQAADYVIPCSLRTIYKLACDTMSSLSLRTFVVSLNSIHNFQLTINVLE